MPRRTHVEPWLSERELLAALQEQAGRGQVLAAKQIHGRVRQAVGKKVSLDYVYRLLHRHGWRKLGPRDRPAPPRRAAESGPLPDVLRVAQYYMAVAKLV